MRVYLVGCIMNVLERELKFRGYQNIIFYDMDDMLEVEADGLNAYVYHLELFKPHFDDINYYLTSVLRQLESGKIKRGDKM